MNGKQAEIVEVLTAIATRVRIGTYGTGDDLDAEHLQQHIESTVEDIALILEKC